MVSIRTRSAYPDNEAELRRAFAAFSGSLERGNAVADQMSSYLPMLGVTATTIPAIDAHLDDLLAAFCAHLREHPFLLGARLSLAACTLMGPLYAHLYLEQVTRKKQDDEELPRGIAQYQSNLRGVNGGVRSYVPWKIQRFRTAAQGASGSARDRPNRLGLTHLVEPRGGPRIVKRDFKLYLKV